MFLHCCSINKLSFRSQYNKESINILSSLFQSVIICQLSETPASYSMFSENRRVLHRHQSHSLQTWLTQKSVNFKQILRRHFSIKVRSNHMLSGYVLPYYLAGYEYNIRPIIQTPEYKQNTCNSTNNNLTNQAMYDTPVE